jgi:rfaE bifunctional protein nucleotidyltransferase chain/domain
MTKIVTIDQAIQISKKLRHQNKLIVLAGGCFDILHVGHVTFLKKAKAAGDILFILLESDEAINTLKGGNRPINAQTDRSTVLASLSFVDFIVPLSGVLANEEYDQLIFSLKPAIIATTQGDLYLSHKKRQADMNKAKLVVVTEEIQNQSTTKIAKLLQKEL